MKDGAIVDGGRHRPDDADDGQRRRPAGRRPGRRCPTSSRRCASSPTWARSPSSTRPTPTRVRRPPPGPLDRRGVGAAGRDGRRGRGLGLQAGVSDGRRQARAAAGARAIPTTSPTTTPSGASRRATRGGCSSSSLLEGAQAGLSWSTILRKREGYARCFAGFDPVQIAAFGDDDVARCLADPGIVRNRAKVNAARRQRPGLARARRPGGASCGSFVGGVPIQNHWTGMGEVPATTAASDAMSKDAQEARLPVRRPDDLLRADAVLRLRQRPRDELLPPRRVRRTSLTRAYGRSDHHRRRAPAHPGARAHERRHRLGHHRRVDGGSTPRSRNEGSELLDLAD